MVDIAFSLLPFLLLIPVILMFPGSSAVGFSLLVKMVFFSSLPALILFYFSFRIFFAGRDRCTPGQRIAGLRLATGDDHRTRAILVRFLLLGILPAMLVLFSGLWTLFLLFPLLPLITRSGSYPADSLVGMTVVRGGSPDQAPNTP